jgi:hypothetical protein
MRTCLSHIVLLGHSGHELEVRLLGKSLRFSSFDDISYPELL